MQVIENLKVKEKLYIEKLENGLTVMVIPKTGIQKKFMVRMIVNLLFQEKRKKLKCQME